MERKINISINLPNEFKNQVETQRLKTDVFEMKSFLDLKKQFKR